MYGDTHLITVHTDVKDELWKQMIQAIFISSSVGTAINVQKHR